MVMVFKMTHMKRKQRYIAVQYRFSQLLTNNPFTFKSGFQTNHDITYSRFGITCGYIMKDSVYGYEMILTFS